MENYIANVIPHLQQWWSVIITLAYLVGIAFTVVAAVQAISQKHRFNRSTAVWSFWSAVLLLNLPTFMDSLSMTVFNQSSEQSLSYTPPSSPGSIYIQFAVYGIMTVGVIGIARGISLMRDTPNQAMNMSRAIVHFFGGILAVNIIPFLRGIGATVGGDVQSYVSKIIG
jgi:hypothetical protein